MKKWNPMKELVFLAGSLKRIGYKRSDVIILLLLTGHSAAVKLAINPVKHFCAQLIHIQYHIDIEYHNKRELNSNNLLKLDRILTKKILADGLIKLLILIKQEYFITILRWEIKRQKWPCHGR